MVPYDVQKFLDMLEDVIEYRARKERSRENHFQATFIRCSQCAKRSCKIYVNKEMNYMWAWSILVLILMIGYTINS